MIQAELLKICQIETVLGGPGGVLRFELDRGVPLEPQNPYPSLRVIWPKRYPFLRIFLQK